MCFSILLKKKLKNTSALGYGLLDHYLGRGLTDLVVQYGRHSFTKWTLSHLCNSKCTKVHERALQSKRNKLVRALLSHFSKNSAFLYVLFWVTCVRAFLTLFATAISLNARTRSFLLSDCRLFSAWTLLLCKVHERSRFLFVFRTVFLFAAFSLFSELFFLFAAFSFSLFLYFLLLSLF